MRISEKTVELNFCKGLPVALGHDLFWFGLTQEQEAKAGFDACTKVGAELLLFQLKASRNVLKNGRRRFLAEHDQMTRLRQQVRPGRRVFYVFPRAGTTVEICHSLCFSHCSLYLDVADLPTPIPLPLAKGKTPPAPRKSNCHYVDVDELSAVATIHSDPFEAPLLRADDLRGRLILDRRADARAHGQDDARPRLVENGSRSEDGEWMQFWRALEPMDRSHLVAAFG